MSVAVCIPVYRYSRKGLSLSGLKTVKNDSGGETRFRQ